MNDVEQLIRRAEQLLERLDCLLPRSEGAPDWTQVAFRWRARGERGYLQAIPRPH